MDRRQGMMRIRVVNALALGTLLLAACGGEAEETVPDGPTEWRGTVHTESAVTTVHNIGGSVWKSAKLIEEASIGGAGSDDAYAFSRVRSVAASTDRIYVLDELARIVTIYDWDGRYLDDIGREGDGPGEFRRPWALGLTRAQTLLVRDRSQGRVHVFSLDGQLLDDWRVTGGAMTRISQDGTVYTLGRMKGQPQTGQRPRLGMWENTPEGRGSAIPVPFFDMEPQYVPVGRSLLEPGIGRARAQGLGIDVIHLPFAPYPVWSLGADGTLCSGLADALQFEARHPDGSVLQVKMDSPSIPVHPDEGNWYRDRLSAFWSELVPEFIWRGAALPTQKRAYVLLIPDHSGRTWLVRELEGRRVPDCDPQPDNFAEYLERPCWTQPYAMEAFGRDGRFLGRIDLPAGLRFEEEMYIRDDVVIAVHEDLAGTIEVKRYRLQISR